MLKCRDTVSLAMTKVKSRKVWTAFFVTVEVFMLTGLLVASAVFGGTKESFAEFSSEGINGRYLVSAYNFRYNEALERDETVWDLADALYDEYTGKHAAIAKELGVDYTKDSEEKPTEYYDGVRKFDQWTKYAQMAIAQRMSGHMEAGIEDLQDSLRSYDYLKIYEEKSIAADGTVVTLDNSGVEDLTQYITANSGDQESIFAGAHVLDRDLFDYYLFDVNDNNYDDGAIPIVMSLSAMEKYLGMDALGGDASDQEKLDRLDKVRSLSNGLIIPTCHRNDASKQLIFAATETKKEIERNKDNPDYVEPNLIYGLPEEACAEVTVEKDARSDGQKSRDVAYREFQTRIGNYEEPRQSLVNFKVIGLIRENSGGLALAADSIWETIKSLGGVSLGTPIIPADYYAANKEKVRNIFAEVDSGIDYYGYGGGYIVEFSDAQTAKDFIENESCVQQGNGCATEDKLFLLSSSNNNSILMDEIFATILGVFLMTLLAILIVTVLSVGKTVARSIAGDRKEIAIFRSIGLKKTDVVGVYLTYAVILTLIVVCLSLALALVIGAVLNPVASDIVTDFLRATFLTLDRSMKATVFVPNLLFFVALCGLVILSAMLSALLPIVLNVRRNIVDGLKHE